MQSTSAVLSGVDVPRSARTLLDCATGAIGATGGLALMTAGAQFLWLDDPRGQAVIFFAGWAATALVSAGIIGVEMRARSRRHHCGLADAMVHQAVEQFLPAAAAGALL